MIKRPWPSSMRTLANDHDRFQKTYFEHYKGYYFTGDGCRRDQDGYYWLTGRPTECTGSTQKLNTTQQLDNFQAFPTISLPCAGLWHCTEWIRPSCMLTASHLHRLVFCLASNLLAVNL